MMPATAVPWPSMSHVPGSAPRKFLPGLTRVASLGCVVDTPESRTATVTPPPRLSGQAADGLSRRSGHGRAASGLGNDGPHAGAGAGAGGAAAAGPPPPTSAAAQSP